MILWLWLKLIIICWIYSYCLSWFVNPFTWFCLVWYFLYSMHVFIIIINYFTCLEKVFVEIVNAYDHNSKTFLIIAWGKIVDKILRMKWFRHSLNWSFKLIFLSFLPLVTPLTLLNYILAFLFLFFFYKISHLGSNRAKIIELYFGLSLNTYFLTL